MRKLKFKAEAQEPKIEKKLRSYDELVREKSVEIASLQEKEILALIEQGCTEDLERKRFDKRVKFAKSLLLGAAKAGEWKTKAAAMATCSIGGATTMEVGVKAFIKLLKKVGKIDLFESLLKVQIGEAKKYIGSADLEEIADIEHEEYGSVTLKPLKGGK